MLCYIQFMLYYLFYIHIIICLLTLYFTPLMLCYLFLILYYNFSILRYYLYHAILCIPFISILYMPHYIILYLNYTLSPIMYSIPHYLCSFYSHILCYIKCNLCSFCPLSFLLVGSTYQAWVLLAIEFLTKFEFQKVAMPICCDYFYF